MAFRSILLFFTFFLSTTTALEHLVENHSPSHAAPPAFLPQPNPLNLARQSFAIQIRAPPTPTIDLALMPSCVQSACLSPSASPLACSPIPTPCPAYASNSTANCTTYATSCYCAQATPLACAFSCSWFNWQLGENWFATTCPSVPAIDYSGLPSCARSCVANNAFDYGCITASRNCFCTHGSLFGCEAGCNSSATNMQKVLGWYATQCMVDVATAFGALDGKSSEAKEPAWEQLKGRKLHWYEYMALSVAGASVVVFALTLGMLKYMSFKIGIGEERKNESNEHSENGETVLVGSEKSGRSDGKRIVQAQERFIT